MTAKVVSEKAIHVLHNRVFSVLVDELVDPDSAAIMTAFESYSQDSGTPYTGLMQVNLDGPIGHRSDRFLLTTAYEESQSIALIPKKVNVITTRCSYNGATGIVESYFESPTIVDYSDDVDELHSIFYSEGIPREEFFIRGILFERDKGQYSDMAYFSCSDRLRRFMSIIIDHGKVNVVFDDDFDDRIIVENYKQLLNLICCEMVVR